MVLPILTSTILLSYSTFIFDLDGVLKTDKVIPNAPEIVNFLYDQNKEVIFVSNNDWESPKERQNSFHQMGFIRAKAQDFINPILVAEDYFQERHFTNKTIFILASQVAKDLFRVKFGAKIVEEKPRIIDRYDFKRLADSIKDPIDAVIMDSFNGFTNENLAKAINYLRNPSVEFFTLSGDDRFKGGFDLLLPDVGAFKLIIETISERKAIPLGKPSQALNEYLRRIHGLDKKKVLFFGDNLNTDIITANGLGVDSCLMLTGVHGLADVERALAAGRKQQIPTFQGDFTQIAQQLHSD